MLTHDSMMETPKKYIVDFQNFLFQHPEEISHLRISKNVKLYF